MSAVRCFVGIPLPTELALPLLDGCEVLRDADPMWRGEKWVRAENLHVTLKFLGDIDEADLDTLRTELGKAVGTCGAFEMPFTGLRASGGLRRCRMVWATFADPSGRCSELHAAVEQAAAGFGVDRDQRPFSPHATLCRARRPKSLSSEAFVRAQTTSEAGPDSMSVVSASLFTSRLTPRGPIYREIGAWRLRGE